MNILVIGNGFDLAHGLPTRYTDFLRFCRNTENLVSKTVELNKEFINIIEDNIWLNFFSKEAQWLDDSKTWIDFEKEIAYIVNKIEAASINVAGGTIRIQGIDIIDRSKIEIFVQEYEEVSSNRFEKSLFVGFVYSQLRALTRAFEIYCLKVNENPIIESVVSVERKNKIDAAKSQMENYSHRARIASGYINRKEERLKYEQLRNEESKIYSSLISNVRSIDYLSMSKFDCVLSFNYTNTYERLYGNNNTKYCYIHGKAQNDRNGTNLILGIDDNLCSGKESRDFRYVKFKKYYQRIIFKTGSEYKDWLDQKESNNYIHIVGHSLDKTDCEVLYEIFTSSNFRILVYYYSQEDFEDKVQKVISLLAYKGKNGRDELIRRVHGSKWSIKFVNQYDEREGLFIKPKSVITE